MNDSLKEHLQKLMARNFDIDANMYEYVIYRG